MIYNLKTIFKEEPEYKKFEKYHGFKVLLPS